MNRAPLSKVQMIASSEVEYATAEDVQKLFATAMSDLFCLAFLLTANAEKAEQCLIQSMRQCFEPRPILRKWLGPWARSTVIRNGTRIVRNTKRDSVCATQPEFASRTHATGEPPIGSFAYSAGILELCDFDRLVYVICVLEHYTVRHCTLLLGRSPAEIREARNRALTRIADFDGTRKCRRAQFDSVACTYSQTNNQSGEFDCSCGSLLD